MLFFFRGFRVLTFTLILITGFQSCSKKDLNSASSAADFQSFSFVSGQDETEIQKLQNLIHIISTNNTSGKNLVASFTLSPGARLTVNGVPQQSGVTGNDFEKDLIYTVTAADGITRKQWTVQATNNISSIGWGLGHFINQFNHEDRNYSWYIDQATSGNYASVNCGPATVTMAIKWADSTFTKSAQDARQLYHTTGGWWYTDDINAYLNLYNITHAIIALSDTGEITGSIIAKQLDNRQIVVLCLDMNYVRLSSNSGFHIDKFYQTTPAWGHFIVLKGYQIVDGEMFFEAYDPYSYGQMNSDETLKGQNRYYRYQDLAAACKPWWNYAFVIAKKGSALSVDAANRKLDPALVPKAHNF
jgi:hypothetical protein